ncbi:hypothetical protein MARPO_0114s0012, partial [Marchantia polymorpha]
TTISLSTPGVNVSIKFLSTVSLLRVSVPVLSLQRTSMPAISSIAVILFVIAPCCARRTVGMAIGIPPINRTKRLSIPA